MFVHRVHLLHVWCMLGIYSHKCNTVIMLLLLLLMYEWCGMRDIAGVHAAHSSFLSVYLYI